MTLVFISINSQQTADCHGLEFYPGSFLFYCFPGCSHLACHIVFAGCTLKYYSLLVLKGYRLELALCYYWELLQQSWRDSPRPEHTTGSREGFGPRSACSRVSYGIASDQALGLVHLGILMPFNIFRKTRISLISLSCAVFAHFRALQKNLFCLNYS